MNSVERDKHAMMGKKEGKENGKMKGMLKRIKKFLPELNFITIHYTYFIATTLLTSLIFFLSSTPRLSVSYTDSLFLVVSGMTEAGLNTVNLSSLSTVQQIILWLLIIIGSSIFVSISTILVRLRAFENRFRGVIREREARGGAGIFRGEGGGFEGNGNARRGKGKERNVDQPPDNSGFESRHSGPRDPTSFRCERGPVASQLSDLIIQEISFSETRSSPDSTSFQHPQSSISIRRYNIKEPAPNITEEIENGLEDLPYPTYLTTHNTGRNAQFFNLSREEREHLGGVEYRAIKLLAVIVSLYFVLWQILAALGLGAYIAWNKEDVARGNGIAPWWLGVFNAVSAFNNSGMSLLDMNMIPFQNSSYALITMGLLILAGNTAYPIFLRLILWSLLRGLNLIYPDSQRHARLKSTLHYILRYPRRIYTHLFPSTPTWWLLFMLIILNGTDWVAFELLNLHNPAVTSIPHNYRILDGLFQAVAVRSGGFYIIAISSLRIGLQVLYMIMMYISAYPVSITIRHSNVYEERSLGIYAKDAYLSFPEKAPQEKPRSRLVLTLFPYISTLTQNPSFSSPSTFISHQISTQLSHDLWLLIASLFIITCLESSNFNRDPITYSVFNIAFEIVSAYGCVGISTGLPGQDYSFSGGWGNASKVVLCAVMIRGRHRGLPVGLDRAVELPGWEGGEEEEGRGVGEGDRDV